MADPAVHPELSDPKKRAYVVAVAETGIKRQAARVAGIHPDTPYHANWRNDLAFQAALRQAEEAAADQIEAEVFRRAVEGVAEPVGWYKGEPGAYVKKYSDVLAIFLLKGLRPEKYRDRIEMRGALANINLNLLPDPLIERIANGENVLSVLASGVPMYGDQVRAALGAGSGGAAGA